MAETVGHRIELFSFFSDAANFAVIERSQVRSSTIFIMEFRNLIGAFLAAAVWMGVATHSSAALVSWAPATAISGDSDVSTQGTLVRALNLGGPGAITSTVNGVTFTGLNLTGNTITSGNFTFNDPEAGGFGWADTVDGTVAPYTSLSSPYRAIMRSVATSFNNVPWTLTMSGLTIGEQYQFQWWSDTSNGFSTTVLAKGTGDLGVVLASNPTASNGGLGQYAIGTFVADSSSQTITFSSSNQSIVNAVQLRDLGLASVPEPATALFGVALVGAMLSTRRRI